MPLPKFTRGAYTKLDYTVKMKMKLLNTELEKNVDQILENFKAQFGEENVTYDEKTKLFWVY